MTRPTRAPRPAPPYRAPVARGQTYPPLGFADDGTPRYRYEPANPAAALPVEPPAPPVPPAPPQPPRRDPGNRVLLGLGAVLVLVLLMAGALKLVSSSGDDDLAQRRDPVLTTMPDDPYLSEVPAPVPPTVRPTVPRRTTPAQPTGPATPTVYEVTTTGGATLMYLDGGRTQVAVTSGGPWKMAATTHGTARVTALLQRGVAGSCKITVDGRVVASRELADDDSALRLLTCQG